MSYAVRTLGALAPAPEPRAPSTAVDGAALTVVVVTSAAFGALGFWLYKRWS